MKQTLAFLLLAAWPLCAQAQMPAPADCPPLVRITSVKLERLPDSRRVAVPVSINGTPKKFLLDTAGISGLITMEAADELKLSGPPRSSRGIRIIKTLGLGGKTYELPNTDTNDNTLISSLKPNTGQKAGDIDGTLIPAFLLNKGELDLDFPGGSLSLFSPNHCPGQVNHWGAPDVGFLPLNSDPLGIPDHRYDAATLVLPNEINLKNDVGHLTVPVTLDGHTLNGWIDTAAEKSSISLEVAERIFNLQAKDLGPQSEIKLTPEAALGFLNNKGNPTAGTKVYRHKFASLSVGHVDIKNLELLVARDTDGRNGDYTRHFMYIPGFFVKTVWNRDVTGWADDRPRHSFFSNAKKDVPDMVLGMDVLRHLHLYISMKEKRVYFSPGAAPAPAAAP